MKYKKVIYFAIIFVNLVGVSPKDIFAQDAAPSLNVDAKAAVLLEPTTGKIIIEQNAHEKLPPASITKVMTMLLIYEAVEQGKIKWDDMVTVSEHAANMGGSQVYLETFEQQTVRDLIKSIAIASANDAAVAMAEFLAGSEEGFVIKMNEKAKQLGMKNTNFINACGLDADNHLTTAYDIALMSQELITRYPDVLELTGIWMDTIIHDTARGKEEFGLANTNKMLRSYSGTTGLKTGSTGEALFCISATAEREELNLVAVILGSPSSSIRFNEARKLLDYGFANYAVSQGEEAGTSKGDIKVYKGEEDSVEVVIKEQISIVIPKGNHVTLESEVELLDALNAPVERGTKAGEVIYTIEGKEVGRSDLIVAKDVEKASLSHMMKRLLFNWF